MPTADSRTARLLALLARSRVDVFLCVRMTNIRYLTGFTGSDAVLLASPDGCVLVTDGRYDEQARREVRDAEVVVSGRKWQDVSRRLRKGRRVGFESRHLSVETYRFLARGREARWTALADPVETLRMRKDESEIRAMEGAAAAASGALLAVLAEGIRGRAEADVAADLERAMKRQGAEDASFSTIVAAGPRASLPHAVPSRETIGRGDGVVIDFGARRRGYCSDETVTLLPRRPAPALRRMFDAARRAQEAGLRATRAGVPCRDVDARVRESLDRAGYLKYFVHSTGHGVGLDIHERPALSVRSKDRLAEGMVVTVEPGIYVPGVGGVRIEDTVRVGAVRAERITYLPKSTLPVA